VSRWQLASHWHLLQITCQSSASEGIQMDGNDWACYCQPDLRLVTCYGTIAGSLWTALNAVAVSHVVISISLDHLRTPGLVSSLWLMPTWSMLSPPGCRHWTPIFFFVRIQALVPWCNKCLNVVCGYVKVWSAPFVTHVTCGQQSQNKVWASDHELLHCLRMYCISVVIM